MFRSVVLSASAALGVIAASSAPASAQNQDTQYWLYLTGTFPVGNGISNTTEISPRWREGSNIFQVRTTFETRVAKGIKLGGGAAVIDFAEGHEIRPHQQLIFSSGHFSARTRFEERFFDGADRVEFRLRQNVQYSQPIVPGTDVWVGAEALYILQNHDDNTTQRGDQWRGEIGLRHHLDDELTVSVAYRGIYTVKENREDTLNNVAILTLAWKP